MVSLRSHPLIELIQHSRTNFLSRMVPKLLDEPTNSPTRVVEFQWVTLVPILSRL